MIYSKGSVVVGEQGSLDGLVGVVVVPDGGGQGQDALQDADGDSGRCASAVAFEVELSLECFVDRLDDLAERLEEPGSGPFGLSLAGRAEQAEFSVGEGWPRRSGRSSPCRR